jgi:hypothetical protein
MSRQFCIIVHFNWSKPILLSVITVADSGASNWHTGQAEGIIYCVFVIVVAPCLEVINGRCFNSRRCVIEVVTCTKQGQYEYWHEETVKKYPGG